MKKNLKIILTFVSISVIILISFLLIGIIAIKDKYEPEPKKNIIEVIKSEKTVETKQNLIDFLENPIDFREVKKSKYITTGVINGIEYHFHPKINDSIFYRYNLITEDNQYKGINKIIVFKYGENKHKFEDETEILIELEILNEDSDLGRTNLVGLTKTELETKFGFDYMTIDNQILYSYKNKVLILELNNSTVKSFNYLKLSTDKIDNDLIQKIIRRN